MVPLIFPNSSLIFSRNLKGRVPQLPPFPLNTPPKKTLQFFFPAKIDVMFYVLHFFFDLCRFFLGIAEGR